MLNIWQKKNLSREAKIYLREEFSELWNNLIRIKKKRMHKQQLLHLLTIIIFTEQTFEFNSSSLRISMETIEWARIIGNLETWTQADFFAPFLKSHHLFGQRHTVLFACLYPPSTPWQYFASNTTSLLCMVLCLKSECFSFKDIKKCFSISQSSYLAKSIATVTKSL